MTLTDYHAAAFAHELTRRSAADSAERLAGALVDAQVDLNPHQVAAALFAFRSPLSKGVLLADEVGLGKTIEAGLVLAQKWAERKRRLLVVTPANLRKQWHQELTEKFTLPCRILEARSYTAAVRGGEFRPFQPAGQVVICSYQFAKSKAADVHAADWDLVVIDEAHRLRNVYKPSNVIANVLRGALARAPKLLLTATPLQNSLLELYGLVSFLDEHAFGDVKTFRERFSDLTEADVFRSLKARLAPLCHRTLRRDVLEYVPYTRRHALVEEFTPAEAEDRLYTAVSDYLQRDNLLALPPSQRALMTLVLRKLLASSTFAIAGALDTVLARLSARLHGRSAAPPPAGLDEDYESLADTADEWGDDAGADPPLADTDRAALAVEVAELRQFRDHAVRITHNAKGAALLTALGRAFAEADRLGAARKAIVFTESRKTQDYLLRLLADSEYADGLVLFNGSNTDPRSKAVYAAWAARHAGTDRVTGSRTADMRSALVDEFRERGRVMIATEAGAEGINLQFCSLVVNYDLPWNPQRIEQRIGRCHRYGQKHDVVVVNFLNRKNEADRRVFELLDQKFKLFEGVFGASDEVLGAIESGVDFEKRIAAIYQGCRTPAEIAASFAALQRELTAEISDALAHTRRQLLDHFDEEVQAKLKVSKADGERLQSRYERLLLQLTRHELGPHATADEAGFTLHENPFPDLPVPSGRYELPRRTGDAHLYRLGHPLAERLLARAKTRPLPPAEVVFDYHNTRPGVRAFQPYLGQAGELVLARLSVESMDQGEDHLLTAAVTDAGELLPPDLADRFFSLCGREARPNHPLVKWGTAPGLAAEIDRRQADIRREVSERNGRLFEQEAAKLDGWADDLKTGLERDIKELDRRIKEAKRAATAAVALADKLAGQKTVRQLEAERNEKRKTLFAAQDEIEARRDALIRDVEAKLEQTATLTTVLAVRWRIE